MPIKRYVRTLIIPLSGAKTREKAKVASLPYHELLVTELSLDYLDSIFHFRVGAHALYFLPIEQGRIEMPQVPRHLRR